jgi:hypothetical protein
MVPIITIYQEILTKGIAMAKFIRIPFIVFFLTFWFNSHFFAITCVADDEFTYDLLTCTIAAIPEPYYRTTVGIGEEVFCAIGNWDSSLPGDAIESITWTLQGDGSLSQPQTGTCVYYYAPYSSSDTTATVTVTVRDIFQFQVTKSVTFDIKIPTAIETYWLDDLPYGITGPPNNWIGGESSFQCVILPNTVNFYRVSFRENIPEKHFPWPDGVDTYSPPFGTSAFSVQDLYVKALDLLSPNVTLDRIDAELWPISYLYNGNGYEGCDFDVPVPNEFYDDTGNWNLFETEHHIRHYSSGGALQIEDNGTVSEEGALGPYQ